MNNEIEGIVLSSIDYKETSKIVYLYTPLGNISLKALQAKKLKSGDLAFITTANIVSFIMTKGDFPTLIEYNLIYSNYNLVSSINKIKVLSNIISIIKQVPHDSPHIKIYPFIKKCIVSLEKEDEIKVLTLFLIKMLYAFGINPNLKECINCNNTKIIDFNVSLGGALCNNCSHNRSNTINLWKEYYYDKKEIKDYSDVTEELVKEVLLFYKLHLSMNIKL